MKPRAIHRAGVLVGCALMAVLLSLPQNAFAQAAAPGAAPEAPAETSLATSVSRATQAAVATQATHITQNAQAAQVTKTPGRPAPGAVLDQLRYDFLYVIASPARLGAVGWGLTAATAAGVYFARDNRTPIQDWWQKNVRSGATDALSDWVKPVGNRLTPVVLSGAFLAGGLAFARPHEFETGLMLAESEIYTLGLTSLGQFAFAEDRPCQGGANHYFDGHLGHGVSGHTAAAAALAGPLNRQYLQLSDSDSDWLYAGKIAGKVLVYGVPVLVGLSRINGDSHYLWNVLTGWAIGYTMGELIPNAHEAKKEGRSWWITPVQDDNAVGVAYQMTW